MAGRHLFLGGTRPPQCLDDEVVEDADNDQGNNGPQQILKPLVDRHKGLIAPEFGDFYVQLSLVLQWVADFDCPVPHAQRNCQDGHGDKDNRTNDSSPVQTADMFGPGRMADQDVTLGGNAYCEPRGDADGHVEEVMSVRVEVSIHLDTCGTVKVEEQDGEEIETIVQKLDGV